MNGNAPEGNHSNSSMEEVKAFGILVRQNHRRLLAYALALVHRPEVAEDLVQESFIVAYRKLSEFDSSRDFGKWLRGIVRMKYMEWLRSRRETSLSNEILEALDHRHSEWDRAAEEGRGESLSALRECMKDLREIAAETIRLFYTEQWSCAAISVRIGQSEAATKKSLQRIRESLARCIQHRLDGQS